MLKATDPFLSHEKQIQASVTPFQTTGINLSENLGNLRVGSGFPLVICMAHSWQELLERCCWLT